MNVARCSLFSVVILSFLSFGCATTRFSRWDESPHESQIGSPKEAQTLEADGDALFADRKNIEKLKVALMKWDLASQMVPSDRLFLKLSLGHYLCGERMQAGDDNDQASLAHYSAGLGYAEKGIQELAPELPNAVQRGSSLRDALLLVPKEGAAILYWYAKNLEQWSRLNGVLTSLRYKNIYAAALKRALAFNDDIESYAHLSDSTEINKR